MYLLKGSTNLSSIKPFITLRAHSGNNLHIILINNREERRDWSGTLADIWLDRCTMEIVLGSASLFDFEKPNFLCLGRRKYSLPPSSAYESSTNPRVTF